MDFSGSVPNSFSKKNISEDFSTTSESVFFWISARFLFLGSIGRIFLYFRRFWQWIFLDQCQIVFPRKIFLRILALLLSQNFPGSVPDSFSRRIFSEDFGSWIFPGSVPGNISEDSGSWIFLGSAPEYF